MKRVLTNEVWGFYTGAGGGKETDGSDQQNNNAPQEKTRQRPIQAAKIFGFIALTLGCRRSGSSESSAGSVYAPSALWQWVRNYLVYVFHKKHDFPPYTASPRNAVYDLLDENGTEKVRIALAGDWGTGTDEAQDVANRMELFKAHFTIIGDVYCVGEPPGGNQYAVTRTYKDNFKTLAKIWMGSGALLAD